MKEGFKSRRYNFSDMTVTEFEHEPVIPVKTPFLDLMLNASIEHPPVGKPKNERRAS